MIHRESWEPTEYVYETSEISTGFRTGKDLGRTRSESLSVINLRRLSAFGDLRSKKVCVGFLDDEMLEVDLSSGDGKLKRYRMRPVLV